MSQSEESSHELKREIGAWGSFSMGYADVEITAAKIIELPPTVPLDAIDMVHSLRKEEREFSFFTSFAIKTLGRFINPKILPVRDIGSDVAQFVRDESIDIMVIFSRRGTGFYGFLTKDEYDIVSKSPPVVVTLPETWRFQIPF